MAVITSALARLRREPLADLSIADQIDQLCREHAHHWRDRLLTPLVTLRLFILQILHGNTAIAHLRQLAGVNFSPASYCEARRRLPLEVVLGLLGALVQWANQHVRRDPTLIGPRILIIDGSSFTTADTPELRKHFGLWPGGKPGVTYPMAKILGLLDAATGLFVQMLALPVLVHDMSHAVHLHPSLRPGDILLGDRAFGSFAHIALLSARGVFGCFRLHQARKCGARRGKQRWHRGNRPDWMTRQQFTSLPAWIEVRLASYGLEHKGFRTRQVTIVTTLLDEQAWTDERLVALYGQRWEIETCFDHLKTTLKMNVLKCQSVEGVLKELAVYLLVYNLVRLAMLQAAQQQSVSVRRISFVDAARRLGARVLGLEGVRQLIVNPDRHGRREPRVIRGRPKAYDMLVRPRSELKQAGKSGENA